MKAWVYTRGKSYYVGWYEPGRHKKGKCCGQGAVGRKLAGKEAERIHSELVVGIYGSNLGKTWQEFREEYGRQVLPGLAVRTQDEIHAALDQFDKIVVPNCMAKLTGAVMDQFIAERRKHDSQRRPGCKVSPATINKELRHIKAALKRARRWGYLKEVPEFDMEREPRRIPDFVTPEHFAKLYAACDKMTMPVVQGFTPADWWRGLIIFAYMTGWRIGEMLALKRADVDLERGEAVTRAESNKGNRDDKTALHQIVVSHLKRLAGFSAEIFPWPHHQRTLYVQMEGLCKLAEVPAYTFHDFRRAFATMNADRMTGDALQSLMRHKSYQTTQGYLSVARQLRPAVGNLFVPEM